MFLSGMLLGYGEIKTSYRDAPFSNCEVPSSVMERMQMLSPPPTEEIKDNYYCNSEKMCRGLSDLRNVPYRVGYIAKVILLEFTLREALRFGN